MPVALERRAEGFEAFGGFEGGQTAGTWLRELLPVALERPAEGLEAFEGIEGGQTAGSNVLNVGS